jgi:hypothetical protein
VVTVPLSGEGSRGSRLRLIGQRIQSSASGASIQKEFLSRECRHRIPAS